MPPLTSMTMHQFRSKGGATCNILQHLAISCNILQLSELFMLAIVPLHVIGPFMSHQDWVLSITKTRSQSHRPHNLAPSRCFLHRVVQRLPEGRSYGWSFGGIGERCGVRWRKVTGPYSRRQQGQAQTTSDIFNFSVERFAETSPSPSVSQFNARKSNPSWISKMKSR